MSRVSFSQQASIPDVLDVIAYEMFFGSIPGGIGSSRGLNLRSKDTNIPGVSNEAFTQVIHGHTRNFRGRIVYSGTWSTTFVETVDGFTQAVARSWHNFCVDPETGNSRGYLKDYSVTARLKVYDTVGATVLTARLEEVFPQEVPDIQLSGEASAAMNVPITWKYSRCIFE